MFTKHEIWEYSRDISSYLAGVNSRQEAAEAGMARVKALTEDQRDEIMAYSEELRSQVAILRDELTGIVDTIFLMEELPEEMGVWREAEVMRYLGAAQKYEKTELLISAILAVPNLDLLFEQVEPADDE